LPTNTVWSDQASIKTILLLGPSSSWDRPPPGVVRVICAADPTPPLLLPADDSQITTTQDAKIQPKHHHKISTFHRSEIGPEFKQDERFAIPMTTATISYVPTDATHGTADLLLGINNGDQAAWDELLRRYGKIVSATVRSFRLQEADALDATQTTWLRLAENAERVQFPERLGGWLATTARRECLRILRQAKLRQNCTDVAPETISDPSPGPEKHVIDASTARMLRKLIDELPPRRRTLMRMLFSDNSYSYGTIARITGIPLGGIGPTRLRALRELRNKLGHHQVGLGA